MSRKHRLALGQEIDDAVPRIGVGQIVGDAPPSLLGRFVVANALERYGEAEAALGIRSFGGDPRPEELVVLSATDLRQIGVDAIRVHHELIALRTRPQQRCALAWRRVGLKTAAQPEDVRAQHLYGAPWTTRGPEAVEECVSRHDLIPVQQEQREQRQLLRRAEVDLGAVPPRGDRAQQP